ncbi:hypothetical protein BJ742DRAFT_832229 [Cladochytrium replicatum]|nr:hypothetical protein BJ742DRAFT_832229 [Cladochytrium replicatum]
MLTKVLTATTAVCFILVIALNAFSQATTELYSLVTVRNATSAESAKTTANGTASPTTTWPTTVPSAPAPSQTTSAAQCTSVPISEENVHIGFWGRCDSGKCSSVDLLPTWVASAAANEMGTRIYDKLNASRACTLVALCCAFFAAVALLFSYRNGSGAAFAYPMAVFSGMLSGLLHTTVCILLVFAKINLETISARLNESFSAEPYSFYTVVYFSYSFWTLVAAASLCAVVFPLLLFTCVTSKGERHRKSHRESRNRLESVLTQTSDQRPVSGASIEKISPPRNSIQMTALSRNSTQTPSGSYQTHTTPALSRDSNSQVQPIPTVSPTASSADRSSIPPGYQYGYADRYYKSLSRSLRARTSYDELDRDYSTSPSGPPPRTPTPRTPPIAYYQLPNYPPSPPVIAATVSAERMSRKSSPALQVEVPTLQPQRRHSMSAHTTVSPSVITSAATSPPPGPPVIPLGATSTEVEMVMRIHAEELQNGSPNGYHYPRR